jgi:hypothetical protein
MGGFLGWGAGDDILVGLGVEAFDAPVERALFVTPGLNQNAKAALEHVGYGLSGALEIALVLGVERQLRVPGRDVQDCQRSDHG